DLQHRLLRLERPIWGLQRRQPGRKPGPRGVRRRQNWGLRKSSKSGKYFLSAASPSRRNGYNLSGANMNLKNAIALVTGGSAGIGYSIAKTLAEGGAKVAITGRDKARLDAAAKDLGAFGIQADVSKEADVER